MKQTQNLTDNLFTQFDKELKAILMYDLKQFKSSKGKFTGNRPGKNQGGLMVA